MGKNLSRLVAGVGTLGMALLFLPPAAQAGETPSPVSENHSQALSDGAVTPLGACNSSVRYREVTSKRNYYASLGPQFHSINSSSASIETSFQNTTSGTVTAGVTGTIEGGVSGAVVSAKASVSASITASVSYSTSLTVTATVPAKKTTYAQIGTSKWKTGIRSYFYNNSCAKVVVGTGVLDAPTSVGWKLWNG